MRWGHRLLVLPVLCLIKMENQEIHPSTLDDSLVPGQLSPRAVVEATLSIVTTSYLFSCTTGCGSASFCYPDFFLSFS